MPFCIFAAREVISFSKTRDEAGYHAKQTFRKGKDSAQGIARCNEKFPDVKALEDCPLEGGLSWNLLLAKRPSICPSREDHQSLAGMIQRAAVFPISDIGHLGNDFETSSFLYS